MKRKKDDLDRLTEKLLEHDPSLKEEFEKADRAWSIAFQMFDLRKKSGLTQTKLAKLVGTRQSNISRLEQGDYNFTVEMLQKIARALNLELRIELMGPSKKQAA